MNDPSVAVSSEDTAQTRADHGRAENLVQETTTRFGIWTPRWQLASPRRALLFTGFAWLSIVVIALRFTCAPVTTDVLAFLAAAAAGFLAAHRVADRSEQGARPAATAGAAGPIAEPDRMRAALLTAVSHDLRSPLAAAAAAVNCLRLPDLQLTAAGPHDGRRARARSIPRPDRGNVWHAPTRPDPWRRPDDDDVTARGPQTMIFDNRDMAQCAALPPDVV